MEYVIVLSETSSAIRAERFLIDAGVSVSVMQPPEQFCVGCGFALRVDGNFLDAALRVLNDNNEAVFLVLLRNWVNNEFVYEMVDVELGVSRVLPQQHQSSSLLDNCTSGGCGAKISPRELSSILEGIEKFEDNNLLVGFNSSDDAAVYKMDDTNSIISTVDFFPPMVADAKSFGRIAAANALSDVYAMGGKPLFALNLVCFQQSMDSAVLREILAGGAEKCAEAGVAIAGGHSIYDRQVKYGLSVTGIAPTDMIFRNNTPRVGDKLILTKPLGVGIILAAERAKHADKDSLDEAIGSMERLNKYAAQCLSGYDVSACTDITGFGLLVHLLEMSAGLVSVELFSDNIPFFKSARLFAEEFLLTAGGQRNRSFVADRVDVNGIPFWLQEIVFDPQTSGGLLVAVNSEHADLLLEDIRVNDPRAAIIGSVIERGNNEICFV